MAKETDNRTATQRIEDLEKVVTSLYQGTAEIVNTLNRLGGLQNDVGILKETVKLLNKKTEAIVQSATPETGISPDSVSSLVVKMNVVELTTQVAQHVKNGQLASTDTVADDSYVVCEESDDTGKVVNPRIQFRIDSLDATTKEALLSKKVGDLVSFGENKFSAKILEIYSLVTPPAATEEAAPTASTDAPAAESTDAQAADASTEAPAADANDVEAPAAPATEASA